MNNNIPPRVIEEHRKASAWVSAAKTEVAHEIRGHPQRVHLRAEETNAMKCMIEMITLVQYFWFDKELSSGIVSFEPCLGQGVNQR